MASAPLSLVTHLAVEGGSWAPKHAGGGKGRGACVRGGGRAGSAGPGPHGSSGTFEIECVAPPEREGARTPRCSWQRHGGMAAPPKRPGSEARRSCPQSVWQERAAGGRQWQGHRASTSRAVAGGKARKARRERPPRQARGTLLSREWNVSTGRFDACTSPRRPSRQDSPPCPGRARARHGRGPQGPLRTPSMLLLPKGEGKAANAAAARRGQPTQ